MWVFDVVWVFIAKCSFLHSLDAPIKMFADSILLGNTGKDQPCSLLSDTVDKKLSSSLVLGKQETCLLFLSLYKK